MKAIKRLPWYVADLVVVWVAKLVSMGWRLVLFILALNSGSAMLGVYLMAGVFIIYSVMQPSSTAAPVDSMVWKWAAFLLFALAMHFLFSAIAGIGARVSGAFWRWRAAHILPKLAQ